MSCCQKCDLEIFSFCHFHSFWIISKWRKNFESVHTTNFVYVSVLQSKNFQIYEPHKKQLPSTLDLYEKEFSFVSEVKMIGWTWCQHFESPSELLIFNHESSFFAIWNISQRSILELLKDIPPSIHFNWHSQLLVTAYVNCEAAYHIWDDGNSEQ